MFITYKKNTFIRECSNTHAPRGTHSHKDGSFLEILSILFIFLFQSNFVLGQTTPIYERLYLNTKKQISVSFKDTVNGHCYLQKFKKRYDKNGTFFLLNNKKTYFYNSELIADYHSFKDSLFRFISHNRNFSSKYGEPYIFFTISFIVDYNGIIQLKGMEIPSIEESYNTEILKIITLFNYQFKLKEIYSNDAYYKITLNFDVYDFL